MLSLNNESSTYLHNQIWILWIFQGDSGGPFVIGGVLYGVVSFGAEECASGLPGVYTKVPYLVEWVKQAANLKNESVLRADCH